MARRKTEEGITGISDSRAPGFEADIRGIPAGWKKGTAVTLWIRGPNYQTETETFRLSENTWTANTARSYAVTMLVQAHNRAKRGESYFPPDPASRKAAMAGAMKLIGSLSDDELLRRIGTKKNPKARDPAHRKLLKSLDSHFAKDERAMKKNPVENRKYASKAISVKKVSRGMKAFDSDNNSATVSYDFGLDAYENAVKAAEALQVKMKWGGVLVGGHTKDGWVFTFRDSYSGRGENPRKRIYAKKPPLQILEGQPGKMKPSRYVYLGRSAGLHAFADESGKPEFFARRKSGHSGWGLQRGGWHYEFVTSVPPVKNNPDAFVIVLRINRSDKNPEGKRLTYDAIRNRFTDNSRPSLYATDTAARDRANILIAKYRSTIDRPGHELSIERATAKESGSVFGAIPRRKNPMSPKMKEGYRARLAGADTNACPYKPDSAHGRDWFAGYRLAKPEFGLARPKK